MKARMRRARAMTATTRAMGGMLLTDWMSF